MTTGIIIQARLGSSRLPAKVLLPLPNGRSVLHEVVQRCALVEDGSDEAIFVAHPSRDWMIEQHLLIQSSQEIRGVVESCPCDAPEDDVLGRYVEAVRDRRLRHIEHIVRITADCPLLNPAVVAEVIALHHRSGADYTSNVFPVRDYPKGWDCEVFTRELLEATAARDDLTDYDREHVTSAMQRNKSITRATLRNMNGPIGEPDCTLDTLEDYRKICNLEWTIE